MLRNKVNFLMLSDKCLHAESFPLFRALLGSMLSTQLPAFINTEDIQNVSSLWFKEFYFVI